MANNLQPRCLDTCGAKARANRAHYQIRLVARQVDFALTVNLNDDTRFDDLDLDNVVERDGQPQGVEARTQVR